MTDNDFNDKIYYTNSLLPIGYTKGNVMILVVDKSQKKANALVDMFYYMGVLSKAVSAKDALTEISDIYRAIIFVSPEEIPFLEDVIKGLRNYSNAPMFAMSSSKADCSSDFLHVFDMGARAPKIVKTIRDYCDDMLIPAPGDYNIAGVNLSATTNAHFYFRTPISFTRTEAMIIRYLIRTYPAPASADNILKYAFKEMRRPDVASVRTFISIINKKFRNATGKKEPAFIEPEFGKGYRILTPEIVFASK